MNRSLKSLAYGIERQFYRHRLYLRDTTMPHFLGIGPGQTGTTWLARHIGSHPDVHVTPNKETDYFSKSFDNVSLRHYASLFRQGVDKIRGEVTPSYSILARHRIADVARILPDARLILTCRDPIERSWSATRRVMSRLGTTIEEISDDQLFAYLEQEWAYLPPNGLVLGGEYEPGLLEGYYTRIMDNWLEHFPAEQLLLVFFDDIKTQPANTLARICRHIGVDPQHSWPSESLQLPINSNTPHRLPERVQRFLVNKYAREIEALAARVGGPANDWLASMDTLYRGEQS